MMKRGSLGVKFSLLLALIWLIGGSATLFTLSRHLNAQAEQTMRERAGIVLTAMQAARNYTQDNIQPLVNAHLAENETGIKTDDNSFYREIIPNFAARRIFLDFKAQDPSFLDYSYKEAAVNPMSPADLADDFEAEIFPQLQPITTALPETRSGYRTVAGNNLFYLAQPLVMTSESCLACHGQPEDAPAPLLRLYGDRHGFGWKLNEVVATQMVYVPADMIFARGRQNLWTVSKTFLGIFGALFITINLLLWRTVIRPLGVLTNTAKQMSQFSTNASKSERQTQTITPDNALTHLAERDDEPGQLARAFEYMLDTLGRREQDLQRAVDERTRSLRQEMRDRQTAQSALQIYAHAMNHDLRNVAMGISSVVQGILFRAKTQDDAGIEQGIDQGTDQRLAQEVTVGEEAIALIQKSCDRQLRLMDTLMEVRSADVWRSALRPKPVALHGLAAELVAMYEAKCCRANLTNCIPTTLPEVVIDASQIQRVFENLIENAVKYNPTGVDVVLSAALDEEQIMARTQWVRCTVADNGRGIDAVKSEGLFELYVRGEQPRGEQPREDRQPSMSGYGLGLYTCRQIVLAHGGQMGVKTAPDAGAHFWFTLPVQVESR